MIFFHQSICPSLETLYSMCIVPLEVATPVVSNVPDTRSPLKISQKQIPRLCLRPKESKSPEMILPFFKMMSCYYLTVISNLKVT